MILLGYNNTYIYYTYKRWKINVVCCNRDDDGDKIVSRLNQSVDETTEWGRLRGLLSSERKKICFGRHE